MGAAGVPLVPGYHGTAQDIDTMKLEADKIGYPILIKPTHGGGGKVGSFFVLKHYKFLNLSITSEIYGRFVVHSFFSVLSRVVQKKEKVF